MSGYGLAREIGKGFREFQKPRRIEPTRVYIEEGVPVYRVPPCTGGLELPRDFAFRTAPKRYRHGS